MNKLVDFTLAHNGFMVFYGSSLSDQQLDTLEQLGFEIDDIDRVILGPENILEPTKYPDQMNFRLREEHAWWPLLDAPMGITWTISDSLAIGVAYH